MADSTTSGTTESAPRGDAECAREVDAPTRRSRSGSGSGALARGAAARRAGLTLGAVALLACASGCKAQRTLTITSNPPGAIVRLDDEVIGVTPIIRPFFHYGTHRIMFYLPGFLSQEQLHKTVPPWYGRFPLDIVSEVLIPIGWRDDERVHAVLVPGNEPLQAPTIRSAIDRAEALRRAGPNGPKSLPPAITDDGKALGDPDTPPPPPGVGENAPAGPRP